MVTLKTLGISSAQEVFDQSIGNLLKQNKRSENRDFGGCLYSSKVEGEVLKCAAGWLISDEEYNPEFEGNTWARLVKLYNISDNHISLIESLQYIHDDYMPEVWYDHFKDLAEDFELEWRF